MAFVWKDAYVTSMQQTTPFKNTTRPNTCIPVPLGDDIAD